MTTWYGNLASRPGPRYLAVAEALAEAVKAGHLAAGHRLPPQRELADTLGVSLGTVTRAYAHATKRGLLRGEVGRGTYVAGASDRWDPLLEPGRDSSDFIDLGPNLPLQSLDPDVGEALAALSRRPGLQALMRYCPPEGARRHRMAGAAWLARHGYPVAPERVVVTAGTQHALSLLLSTLCRSGDGLLSDAVTYPGVRNLATLLNLKLLPVEADGEGLLPEALDRAALETRARVLYCMPTLQNPTGTSMGSRRRAAIAEVARGRDLFVVEDDIHGLLADEAEPPLSTQVPERGFYVAGTSKLLSGGLRIAYAAAPAGELRRLAFAMASSMWLAPPLMAELATCWIGDGVAERVVGRKRAEAAARIDLARSLLGPHCPPVAPHCYFVWLQLPEPWTPDAFAAAVRKQGVAVLPSSAFAVRPELAPRAVRLSLSAPQARGDVEQGLRIVRATLDAGPYASSSCC